MSFPELVAALTIASLAIGVATPTVSGALRSYRLDGAARDMSVEIHRVRMEAVSLGRYVGILFTKSPTGDRWRVYRDGGLRGISAAEISSGVDQAAGPTQELRARHSGVRIGIPEGPPIPRIPPASGRLSSTDDPIAFGNSDIFSSSPTGETSGGTLYLTDGIDARAVVVYGPTGRIRIWRYEARERAWRR